MQDTYRIFPKQIFYYVVCMCVYMPTHIHVYTYLHIYVYIYKMHTSLRCVKYE